MRCIAAASLLIPLAAGAAAGSHSGHPVPAAILITASAGLVALSQAELPDQRGKRDSLGAHRGSAVVVIIVNARRLGTVPRWARDVEARFPKVHLLTVADVNETRPSTLERVTEVLARRVPSEVAVLIDMNRVWANELKLDTAEPNLVVVGPDGALVAQFRGRWSAGRAAAVAASIASLGKTA